MKTRIEVDGVGLVAEGAMAPYLELDAADVDLIMSWAKPTVVLDVAPWCGFGVEAADRYKRVYCDSPSQWTSWQRNEEKRTAKRSEGTDRVVRTGRLDAVFDAAMEKRCVPYFTWADIDDDERRMFRTVCAGYDAMAVGIVDQSGGILAESLLVKVDRMAEWYLVFTHWMRDDARARRMMLGVRALFVCARLVCDEMATRFNMGPAMTYKSAVATSSEPALGLVFCEDAKEGEWTDYVPQARWNKCR